MKHKLPRLLHRLVRRVSSAGAGRRVPLPSATARPGLEVLEGRALPSTLILYSSVSSSYPSYLRNLQIAPLTIYTLALPSPTALANKGVWLSANGTQYGALVIGSVQPASDGSGTFTFSGTYESLLLSTKWNAVPVTGTLGAPQFAGLGVSTFSISFQGSTPANATYPAEVVDYQQASVTETWSGATTSGQLSDAIPGPPGQGAVPASGTFVW
jgi:hypothetical protein